MDIPEEVYQDFVVVVGDIVIITGLLDTDVINQVPVRIDIFVE